MISSFKPYIYPAKLVNVVDGDTIDVDLDLGFNIVLKKIRVRLLDYNAPECKGEEFKLGNIAKESLKKVLDCSKIYVSTTKSDVFGRWLAHVYFEKYISPDVGFTVVHLNSYLVESGYGVKWDGKGERPNFKNVIDYPIKF